MSIDIAPFSQKNAKKAPRDSTSTANFPASLDFPA